MATRSSRWLERLEYDPLDPAKQHAPLGAGALVSRYVDGRVLKGASDASRALVTWRRIAGARASRHTVAVWLNRPKSGRGLPELVVYLDGNALMADLTTNAELYVERLAYAGLHVARVRFRLSRRAGELATSAAASSSTAGGPYASVAPAAPAVPGDVDAAPPAELPPLTPSEELAVERACARLPEKVRPSACEAMRLSMRRGKLQTTRDEPARP